MQGMERFAEWLRRVAGYERARVIEAAPVEGGVSNLTSRVVLQDAPVQAVALRVQREQGIFAPYDVVREARVIEQLAQSPIPVPGVVGVEARGETLGAPFIVLEWIDAPHMGVAGGEADFGAYTGMVVAIHTLDWESLGLGEVLETPASAAEASALELERVAARMAGFGCADDPVLSGALEKLRATVPGDGRLALCQGDINVFNYLFRAGRVAGVVDWEQARIGDPRSDVGQLVALSHLKGAPFGPAGEMMFVRAYESVAGGPLGAMEWFRARWLWELGVIYHGWVAFNDSQPWYTWEHLVELLEASLTELR